MLKATDAEVILLGQHRKRNDAVMVPLLDM